MVNDDLPKPEALRRQISDRGIGIAWFCLGSLPLFEIAARQGADAVLIDLQHGLWDRASTHLAVGLSTVPVLVRPADSSFVRIGEALDSGAAGVLVPHVETAAQARAIVNAVHFPPRGQRSGGGVRPLSNGFQRYHEQHRATVVGAMIESSTSVANAAAIAQVDGIDFLFVGTGDLALSLGCFPEVDERLEESCRKVLEACREASIPCGIFTGTAEAARQKLAEGYRATVIADDLNVVRAGFRQATQRFLARSSPAGN